MTKDMYVKSNWFFILYKALLVIAAAYGLHFHMAAGKWGDFNYYTVLSNAVCFFYFLASLVFNVRRLVRGCHTVTWRPRAEGAVVFCITVTSFCGPKRFGWETEAASTRCSTWCSITSFR